MNIKLIYNNSSCCIDILKDSSCQYLYQIASKIYKIQKENLTLYYNDIPIKSDSQYFYNYIVKDDIQEVDLNKQDITIIVKNSKSNNESPIKNGKDFIKKFTKRVSEHSKLPKILNGQSLLLNSVKKDNKSYNLFNMEDSENNTINKYPKLRLLYNINNKKIPVKCQSCAIKYAIFYCRECNTFICFECNIRHQKHKEHDRINIEDDDSKFCYEIYKEEILKELEIAENGFQKSEDWMIENNDRDIYLASIFKLLEDVKKKSLALLNTKTPYSITQNDINELRNGIENLSMARNEYEVVDCFTELNIKDKTLQNIIKFVDLQIVKSEYNKILLKNMNFVQKYFENILKDVNSRLENCKHLEEWKIAEIKSYLRDSQKMNLTENFNSKNNDETFQDDITSNKISSSVENESNKIIAPIKNNHNLINNNNHINELQKLKLSKIKNKEENRISFSIKDNLKNTRSGLKAILVDSETIGDNKNINISNNLSLSNNNVKNLKKHNKINSLEHKSFSLKKDEVIPFNNILCETEINKKKSYKKLKTPTKISLKKNEIEITNEARQKNLYKNQRYINGKKNSIEKINNNNADYSSQFQSLNPHLPNYEKPFSKVNKYRVFKHNKYISNRNDQLGSMNQRKVEDDVYMD